MRRLRFGTTRAVLATVLVLSCSALWAQQSSPLKAMHHVGISTPDIERSIRFYRDLLGMELLSQGKVENRPDYDNIFGLQNVKAKGAMLRLGSMRIELFEFEQPAMEASEPMRPVHNPPRIYHICFEVEDLQKEYERLKAAGVPFHYPPQDFGIAKAVYGRDPDGNVIELLEWPKKQQQDKS